MLPRNEQVVVGVDGSSTSALALKWAAEEAGDRGWSLIALLAWDLLDQHHADLRRRFDPEYDEGAAKEALSFHVRAALGESAATTVELRVICGHPAPSLVEAADGSALLVVGARGLGGVRGALLGSVSQHCLHHARVPVAVVRETATSPNGRIVVGYDGSENAEAALHWAADHALATGRRLDVLHAWHPPYIDGQPFAFSTVGYEEFNQTAETILDRGLAKVERWRLPSVPGRVLVTGGAAGALIDAALDASLVVVGSRGHGGFAGLLLGSVSTQVARHAPCPVVVVPALRDDR